MSSSHIELRNVFTVKNSTIGAVWVPVLSYSAFAVLVALLDLHYNFKLYLANAVTPLISIVLGLLLVFFNTSAYARWTEAKNLFTGLTATVRQFSKAVSIHVGAPLPGALSAAVAVDPKESARDLDQKRAVCRLMVAFVIATKHHLREEYGPDYADLRAVLPPQFYSHATKKSTSTLSPHLSSVLEPVPRRSKKGRRGSQAMSEISPLLRPSDIESIEESTERSIQQESNHPDQALHPVFPISLLISHQISLYLLLMKQKQKLESIGPAGYNNLHAFNSELVRLFTFCERLERGGVPRIYPCHLHQCLFLFLFTLPFTLIDALGWKMPPAVSLIAFTLLGIESIARELEFPFGIDANDLPLDEICRHLYEEMEFFLEKMDWTASDSWF